MIAILNRRCIARIVNYNMRTMRKKKSIGESNLIAFIGAIYICDSNVSVTKHLLADHSDLNAIIVFIKKNW